MPVELFASSESLKIPLAISLSRNSSRSSRRHSVWPADTDHPILGSSSQNPLQPLPKRVLARVNPNPPPSMRPPLPEAANRCRPRSHRQTSPPIPPRYHPPARTLSATGRFCQPPLAGEKKWMLLASTSAFPRKGCLSFEPQCHFCSRHPRPHLRLKWLS